MKLGDEYEEKIRTASSLYEDLKNEMTTKEGFTYIGEGYNEYLNFYRNFPFADAFVKIKIDLDEIVTFKFKIKTLNTTIRKKHEMRLGLFETTKTIKVFCLTTIAHEVKYEFYSCRSKYNKKNNRS